MSDLQSSYDFIIIGNGIMGLSLAYEIAKKDSSVSVLVVGPSNRKGAATTAAGAMINVFSELSDGVFDDPALKARAELSIKAYPLWNTWCAEIAEASGTNLAVTWGTYLYKTPGASEQEDRTLDLIEATVKQHDLNCCHVKKHELEWFNPKNTSVDSNLLEVPDGRIDPNDVLNALELATQSMGVSYYDDKIAGLEISETGGSHTVYLENAGQKVSAPNIVLANGSFAQDLVDQIPVLKREVPRLLWGQGSAVEVVFPNWVKRYGGVDPNTLKLDTVIRSLVRDNACGLHIVPRASGKYYIGASAAILAEKEEYNRLHSIETLIVRVVDEISRGFFFAGMELLGPGNRPVTSDCFPLLGESHVSGIWYSNGMKRDGLTCSPFISRELAAEMLGSSSELPKLFKPERKLISYKTKAKAIAETVISDFHGDLMHGLVLPPYGKSAYQDARQKAVEGIYEKRCIDAAFGIHPEIIHLYDNDEYFRLIDHAREQPL